MHSLNLSVFFTELKNVSESALVSFLWNIFYSFTLMLSSKYATNLPHWTIHSYNSFTVSYSFRNFYNIHYNLPFHSFLTTEFYTYIYKNIRFDISKRELYIIIIIIKTWYNQPTFLQRKFLHWSLIICAVHYWNQFEVIFHAKMMN